MIKWSAVLVFITLSLFLLFLFLFFFFFFFLPPYPGQFSFFVYCMVLYLPMLIHQYEWDSQLKSCLCSCTGFPNFCALKPSLSAGELVIKCLWLAFLIQYYFRTFIHHLNLCWKRDGSYARNNKTILFSVWMCSWWIISDPNQKTVPRLW